MDALLQETGDRLLQETGDDLLLEQQSAPPADPEAGRPTPSVRSLLYFAIVLLLRGGVTP